MSHPLKWAKTRIWSLPHLSEPAHLSGAPLYHILKDRDGTMAEKIKFNLPSDSSDEEEEDETVKGEVKKEENWIIVPVSWLRKPSLENELTTYTNIHRAPKSQQISHENAPTIPESSQNVIDSWTTQLGEWCMF